MVRFNSGETARANMAALWMGYSSLKYIQGSLERRQRLTHSVLRYSSYSKHFQRANWHETYSNTTS